jgi:beta-glucosidase
MIKKHQLGLSGLALMALLSCQQPTPVKEAEGNDVPELSMAYEAQIDSIIAQLSLEEKVKMLHGTGMFWSGGIERLGIPELQYADGPLGIREEIERGSWNALGWTTDSATFFPAGSCLGATWNTELSEKYGHAIGQEARARQKDILLAPAINIMRTPLCGRNYEYFSEDPFLNAQMVVPYVVGVQKEDIGACVKHFAINNQETLRGSIDVYASERAIREIYLPGFQAAIEKGKAYSVMGAYNQFRGEFLCHNDYMLNQILRKEWGFKGVVVSDWAAVHNTVKAVNGGLDIEMGSIGAFENFFMANPLVEAVKKGEVKEAQLDEKVRRILRVMFNLKTTDSTRMKGQFVCPEHSQVVYQTAAEAIVLLKNDKNVLPLDASKIKTMAVIGDNANRTFAAGGFGAGVKAKYEVTALQGLKNRLGNSVDIRFAKGYTEKYLKGRNDDRSYGRLIDYTPDAKLIAEAVAAAKSSDVAVVFAGSNRNVESESVDRDDARLPFAQEALIKAVAEVNPNTVVVLTGGAAYELGAVSQTSPALLWNWFSGSENGNALADVILGKVNPSGKLPFTMPKSINDIAAHALKAFPGDGQKVEYLEGILVGYRWFDTKNIDPQYPFGYGLSYTTFDISDVKADKAVYGNDETIKVTLNLKNSGSKAGAEVVQLYAHANQSKVERAAQELKGFKKVMVDAGAFQLVTIEVPVSSLAYYDETAKGWVVEPGQYTLKIGTSSRDIRGEVMVEVK